MHVRDYGLKAVDFQAPGLAEPPRRTFMVTSLAAGFALASSPVLAQAITTDTHGLEAGEIQLPVADGHIPAYVARPAKGGRHPVLLVVQEVFGVHEHIRDMCRRYAKQGYYAIAPELYARQGNPATYTDLNKLLGELVSKVPDDQVCRDLDAAVAYAGASGHADPARLGLVGWCWGGRAAWVYARHNPSLKAAVAYYGLLEGLRDPALRPQDPVDFAAEVKVPVLGLYASQDKFITAAQIEAMQHGLDKGTSGSEIVVMADTDHGFNADYRPTYDKRAATYAQQLANDWLKRHGV